MNRDYRAIASLENAARIERSVFEYRKLVLGLMARILVSWAGGEAFFISLIERVDEQGATSKRDFETMEQLFCFPTKVPHPRSYDFERFAYNCPQYYLRQAIVSALNGLQRRAKFVVKPHFENGENQLTVLDVVASACPWFIMQGSEMGLYFNLDDHKVDPSLNFWSDLDEVFRRPLKENIFTVKLFNSASRSWIWCELYATHGSTDADLAAALAQLQWADPILLPKEMIRWYESHLQRSLCMLSAKTPDFASEHEFQVFKGIELPPSFISYALEQAKVAK